MNHFINLDIYNFMTVNELKFEIRQILTKENILFNVNRMILTYKNNILKNDNNTLESYNICNHAKILLSVNMQYNI